MALKRIVYRIAGTDFEAYEKVYFTFYVQRVSINNFLNLELDPLGSGLKIRDLNHVIGDFTIDSHHTWVDTAIKPISVQCSAFIMFYILKKLGIRDHNDIDTPYLNVRNIELRAKQSVKNERYNGIHVFDPKTKKSWLTSNLPKKIDGRQAIINGKLWRKYISL